MGLTPNDAFRMFDLDQTGKITKTAFRRVIGALGAGEKLPGKTVDSEERKMAIEAFFDKLDLDRSGEISYTTFRSAWVKLVDVNTELTKRQRKPYSVPRALQMFQFLADILNRAALLTLSAAEEAEEKQSFQRARQHIDRLRVEARTRRDEHRRARQAERERVSLVAAKDIALRNKDRAARLVQEQKLRNKQRAEEKLMKNRLEAEQAAAKRRENAALKAERKKREADRVAMIRMAGADRLDCSRRSYRLLPAELYIGRGAQEGLADLVMLDLGENCLETLPTGFLMWFASLRYLRLTANRLEYLPKDELGDMGQLEVLKVNSNNLIDIPDSIGELSMLRELRVSNNNLRKLPSSIQRVVSIECLSASSNQLVSLPDMSGLQFMRDLCLRGNKLFELPESLPDMVSLTRLDVHNNQIHKLPQNIGDLKKLRVLNISVNRVTTFPDSASGLSGCESFLLQENEILHLGVWAGGWKCASFLDIRGNKIEHVDRSVGSLRNLTVIRLDRNKIEQLSPQIGLAQSLEVLHVSDNILKKLPVELGALALLHTLKLCKNFIFKHLPEQLGLLRSVTDLDISQNMIESLPDTIGGLGELVKLNLAHNRLSTVPETIIQCTRLHELYLSSNHIKRLPMHLGKCTPLRILDLQSNLIVEIPANLACLINLRSLHLGKNLLRALPLDIVYLCETVEKLSLDRNPFTDLPPRWAKFSGCSAHERSLWPSGYNNELAISWVKDHSAFYQAASEEWQMTGPMHVSSRSNLAAYEAAVKKRCGPAWQPHLLSLVRAYYFKARHTGSCPKFNYLTAIESKLRSRARKRIASIRNSRHRVALDAAAEYNTVLTELYHSNLLCRLGKIQDLGQIRRKNRVSRHSKPRKTIALKQAHVLKADQDREGRIELEELHAHLWSSFGCPADGEHFFPSGFTRC